jgi:GLPGLI family protein
MNNKIIFRALLFCFLLINNFCFSQSKSIKIEYSKEVLRSIDTSDSKFQNKLYNFNKLLYKNSQFLVYELLINDNISKFQILNTIQLDEVDDTFYKLAGKLGGTNGIFYLNKKDSTYINQKYFLNNLYNIRIEVGNWTITSENKKINNFLCFKAIKKEKINDSDFREVVAWFSPQLPSFYGPAGYFGLPGTILELNNGVVVIKSEKISFLDKKKSFESPIFKEIISQEDYEVMLKK